jgi:hypothetical protein
MTVYFAGNKVFRTRDFGSTWETLSPDLTTNDPEKLGSAGGPVWPENTTAEYHCTIVSFAESPADASPRAPMTEFQVSRDGGSWENVVANVPGVPARRLCRTSSPLAREPAWRTSPSTGTSSTTCARTCSAPRISAGASSRSAGASGQSHVWVPGGPRNPDLLYVERSFLYATRDSEELSASPEEPPTVAVHYLLVHARDNDLVVGTHGRGLFIFDDATPIQRIDEAAEKRTHLFPIRRAVRFQVKPTRYGIGDKIYVGPNPPYGALLTYFRRRR